jgi:DNA-binding MarR family transcriptional regulator
LPSKLQQHYERTLITYPLVIKKLNDLHGINQGQLWILLIINNANRNANKITRIDIQAVTGYSVASISNILDKLKKMGYITLNFDYQLTDQGRRLLLGFSSMLGTISNGLDSDTFLSFAEYSNKNTKKATYKYKVKNNMIKDPEKSKYNKLL